MTTSISSECFMSNLNLFDKPVTNTSILDNKQVTYFPNTPINDDSPIEFNINSPDYTDLQDHYVRMVMEVVRKDGTEMSDADNGKVVVVPLPGNSMFSSVENYLNGTLVNHANSAYGYRCFLETLATYGASDTTGLLSLSVYYPDHHSKHQALNAMFVDNNGLARRRSLTLGGPFECICRLHLDLFQQPRLLLPYVTNRVRLYRSKGGFPLICTQDTKNTYKLVLREISLTIKHVMVSPFINNAHKLLLQNKNACYPILRTEIKSFTVPSGVNSFNQDNLFLGRLPLKVIIGLVKAKAYDGSSEHHPYQFVHANVNKIALFCNGEIVNSTPYQPDFGSDTHKANKYGREYLLSLFQTTNQMWSNNSGFSMGLFDYKEGFTLFGFNLSPSGYSSCTDSVIEGHKHGTVRIDIGFAKDLWLYSYYICRI